MDLILHPLPFVAILNILRFLFLIFLYFAILLEELSYKLIIAWWMVDDKGVMASILRVKVVKQENDLETLYSLV